MDRDQRRRARQPGRTTQQRLADAYAGYRSGLYQLPADDYLEALARAGELAEWEGFAFWDVQRASPAAPELARFRHEPSGLLFVLLPGGTCRFGAGLREPGRERGDPARVEVRVEPFLIAETPVTRQAWERLAEPAQRWCAEPLPRAPELAGAAGERPMEGVTYPQALAWCRAAGLLRVPGEVEWEYACRASSASLYAGGNTLPPDAANTLRAGHEATTPVRSYPANAFGLYDLHGNVAEWCADQTLGFRALWQREVREWHQGGRRRGGSFLSTPEKCRCAALDREPERPGPDGFRPVRSLEPGAAPPRDDEGSTSEVWAYRCGGLSLGLPSGEGSRYAEALLRARAHPDLRCLGPQAPSLRKRGGSGPEVMANYLYDQACRLVHFLHEPTGLPMVLIPGGTLRMGSDEREGGEPAERPARRVRVEPYLLSIAPLTRQVVALPEGGGPVEVRGLPATGISWFQARELCAARGLRLPSEAEWEHACRAGRSSAFSWGDNAWGARGQPRANFASERPTRVDRFEPNRFGLRDMHGNVEEWCEDAWHPSYEGAPGRAQPAWADEPEGLPWEQRLRVLRGGCFLSPAHHCRAAARSAAHPGTRSPTIGVRAAMSV